MTLKLDPATTALVLIDLQKGITSLPLTPHDKASVVRQAEALGRGFAARGASIVLVRVAFAPDFADGPGRQVDSPMQVPPGGLPPGFSEFEPDIAALPADVIVTKRQWGAFYGTDLDLQLRRRGITTIVLAGVATNFGVEQTAREAWQGHYAVVVAEDATSSVADGMHRFSVEKILPRIARIRTTAEILAAL